MQGRSFSNDNPFDKYSVVVDLMRTDMKGSPLGFKGKMTTLSPGQLEDVVKNMDIGGFGMLQVRCDDMF